MFAYVFVQAIKVGYVTYILWNDDTENPLDQQNQLIFSNLPAYFVELVGWILFSQYLSRMLKRIFLFYDKKNMDVPKRAI